MAMRLRLKLPKLSVNQISTKGEVSHRTIPRGCVVSDPGDDERQSTPPPVTSPPLVCDSGNEPGLPSTTIDPDLASMDVRTLPSLHSIAQKSVADSWAKVRMNLLQAAIESSSMPANQLCILCCEDAEYRCLQCGPKAFFCHGCFDQVHKQTNLFHTGEIWDDLNGVYRPLVMKRTVNVLDHCCQSVNLVPLCCITEHGEEHNILFASCGCEPLVVTMVRARLWPSAPQRPHLAFTFDLMDWMEALLLECQVSVNDFCKALCLKCRHLVVKRKDIYSTLINAFEEYRWLKVELRQLTLFCPELDKGNVCPACPQESGTVVYSMDALFGLPRKKAAGISHRESLHGELFFCDQSAVDEYVSSCDLSGQKLPNMCSHFLAGDALRSSKRYHALDETAVFGCACRHEFPKLFINLKHGERLSYAVWLLEELVQHVPMNANVYIMYDIACNLVRHLKVNRKSMHLLERMKFALPSFHAFGHNMSCQVSYGPTRCEGIGMSDGEVMERMWSYFRRFSRMTKEMRPSHRIDILSHALLYYGVRTKQRLSSLLVSRWKRATEMNIISKRTLEGLCKSLSGQVTDAVIKDWIKDSKEAVVGDSKERTLTYEWTGTYYNLLQSYYMARDRLNSSCGKDDLHKRREEFFSLDSKLADMERRFGVTARWKSTDNEYKAAKAKLMLDQKQHFRTSLWACVVKRHYLLQMKAKYADGQKIAKKLSMNITRETNRIKSVLTKLNECMFEVGENLVSLTDVLSLSSEFWAEGPEVKNNGEVNWKLRQEIIEAFLLLSRSNEELHLLKVDMICTVRYWFMRRAVISTKLDELKAENNSFVRGLKCLLEQARWEADLFHFRACSLFSGYIELPTDIQANQAHAEDISVASDDESDCSEEDLEMDEDDF